MDGDKKAPAPVAQGGYCTRPACMTTGGCKGPCAMPAAPAPVAQGEPAEDLAYFIRRVLTLEAHAAGESWCWRGDGSDNLGSMVGSLPVVIRADQLRALIASPAPVLTTAQALSDEQLDRAVAAWFEGVAPPHDAGPKFRARMRAAIEATGQEGGK